MEESDSQENPLASPVTKKVVTPASIFSKTSKPPVSTGGSPITAPIFSKSSRSLSSSDTNGSPKPASLFSKPTLASISIQDSNGSLPEKDLKKKVAPSTTGPLADRMRPSSLSTYSGQETAVGPKSQLRSILDSDNLTLPSLILWGPPGCGKTSLANVIANKTKSVAKFVKMSACTCGVNEVREVIKQAKNEQAMFKRKTILFMDEVHRFNKAQQDSFLPHIESGTITFIGATTENPSFSLNPALLSRCRVVSLEKLSKEAVFDILSRAVQDENISKRTISKEALEYLAGEVDGDARSALNSLELVMGSVGDGVVVSVDHMKEALLKSAVKYDKEQHYLLASALQKSIRGSNDSAALYYLARMIKGGEDPMFIARRLVRCASEDVGLADPTALPLAVSAMQGTQMLGRPECDVLLAQATVHLARARKSHEVYGALSNVYNLLDTPGDHPPVPLQLRNSTGKLTGNLGWGKGYSFNLAEVGNTEYMPAGLEGRNFFKR